MRLRIAVLLLSLSAVACTKEGDGADGAVDSAGMMAGEPMVTPAESAAAARAVQQHADSIHREVMKASGLPSESGEPAPRPANPPTDLYESCIRQARSAEARVRERLEQACATLRSRSKG